MARSTTRQRQGLSALAAIALGLYLSIGAADTQLKPLLPEAGYSDVEQIQFALQRPGARLVYTSSRAEIFYNFHPAEQDPAGKPLFVFFNGGPGCPTCEGLLSTNTGPRSMHPQPWGPTPPEASTSLNPDSWTSMGNLLYIDAPATGYSYNLHPTPRLFWPTLITSGLYDAQNFNPYIDAAQMVRVLLRFLSAHPAIRDNPVVLVGESYGGTRVTTMLNLLLNYHRYGDRGTDIYVDPQLALEVQRYLDQRYRKRKGWVYPPRVIAKQFGRQILIQPQLTGANQSEVTGDMYEEPNSPIDQLAWRKGKVFERCIDAPDAPCNKAEHAIRFVMFDLDISPYHTQRLMQNKENGYVDSEAWVTIWTWARLFTTGPATELLHFDVTQIDGLYIANRAFRDADTGIYWSPYNLRIPLSDSTSIPEPNTLPGTERAWIEAMPQLITDARAQYDETVADASSFGRFFFDQFGLGLPPNLNYVSCPPLGVYHAFYRNSATAAHFDITPESVRYGELFLGNLPFVKTMITNADLDLMIYSPALTPSLRRYDLVKSADAHSDCADCDGTIEINYQRTAFAKLGHLFPRRQTIWFPRYRNAGHAVSASMPRKLIEDVAAWMAGTKP